MGHHFTIEGDEAFALAQELAAMTGGSIDAAVTQALRVTVQQERKRLETEERLQKVLSLATDFRAMLGPDTAGLDTDFLYDPVTGLPT